MVNPKRNATLLSIVIVNYNTAALTLDCLGSIQENPPSMPYEVIVVDNGSSDGSVEAIKKGFDRVLLIENDDNLGFAVACNQGARKSMGKYILLLNSDTRIQPGALDKMLDFLEGDKSVGLAGGKMINLQGNPLPSVKPFPTYFNIIGITRNSLFKTLFESVFSSKLRELPEETTHVDAMAGGYLFMRRKALKETGLLDERFFMYMEDVDLALRMKLAGWKTMYYPESVVVHIHEGTSSMYKSRTYFYHHISLYKYFQKHYPNRFIINYLLLISLLAHYILWLLDSVLRSTLNHKENIET
ncbi:glycosyltransferase family 2 protein [bacterium]|nr:glycosyltransferase family 2 protein [bacterium]